MLLFTNRKLSEASDDTAFTTRYTPGSDSLSLGLMKGPGSGSGNWSITERYPDFTDDEGIVALDKIFRGSRPVLVYLHGNSNTPRECLQRCAKLERLYNVEVIGFSWPSEGMQSDGTELPAIKKAPVSGDDQMASITLLNRTTEASRSKEARYRQAKVNAESSTDALARFFRLLAIARLYSNVQPHTIAAHSLGAHFLRHSLAISGAPESLAAAMNVILLASCTRANGHRSWLSRITPQGQVIVTFFRADGVLAAARIVDGEAKLGTDPMGETLQSPRVRYISFNGAKVGGIGHAYFVQDKTTKENRRLFTRLFQSQSDVPDGTPAPTEYFGGCDATNTVCFMAKPSP